MGVTMNLIECVPNYSEVRDKGVIARVNGVIESVDCIELKIMATL